MWAVFVTLIAVLVIVCELKTRRAKTVTRENDLSETTVQFLWNRVVLGVVASTPSLLGELIRWCGPVAA